MGQGSGELCNYMFFSETVLLCFLQLIDVSALS